MLPLSGRQLVQRRIAHLCMPAKQQPRRGQNVYIKHGGTQLHDCSVSSRVFATVLPADRCFPLAYVPGGCKSLKS